MSGELPVLERRSQDPVRIVLRRLFEEAGLHATLPVQYRREVAEFGSMAFETGYAAAMHFMGVPLDSMRRDLLQQLGSSPALSSPNEEGTTGILEGRTDVRSESGNTPS